MFNLPHCRPVAEKSSVLYLPRKQGVTLSDRNLLVSVATLLTLGNITACMVQMFLKSYSSVTTAFSSDHLIHTSIILSSLLKGQTRKAANGREEWQGSTTIT